MYKLSDFKVYRIGPIFPFEKIYAVLAYSKIEMHEKVNAEWYYFIKHKNSKMNKLEYIISCSKPFNDIWVDLLESLKQGIYQNEFLTLPDKTGDFFSIDKIIELTNIDLKELIFNDDNNHSFIKYIQENTRCDEFKNCLNYIK